VRVRHRRHGDQEMVREVHRFAHGSDCNGWGLSAQMLHFTRSTVVAADPLARR
jgi:hypothetical protein